MRVLIIEDEQGIVETLRASLEAEGHEVAAAGNGGEGVEKFMRSLESGRAFQAVVVDMRMPVKDGVQVIQEILAARPEQKIIVATAYPYELVKGAKAIPKDKVQVLRKPFDPEDLITAIEKS